MFRIVDAPGRIRACGVQQFFLHLNFVTEETAIPEITLLEIPLEAS